ncbi:MAG TPA: hypothetical protein VMU93_01700 [Caulobacteraceae bacterium]|nr:hypothetical protein [Caulobacteraceae bacterium]
MTISVQTPASALLALENLQNAQSRTGAVGGGDAAVPLGANRPQPSSILDVGAAPGGLGAATASLARAASIADAAVTAGDAVTSLLGRMRQAALAAADPSSSGQARIELNASFQADMASIDRLASQASVGGVNLIDGSAQGDLQLGADAGPGAATLTATNLSLSGPLLALGAGADISDPSAAANQAQSLAVAIGKAQSSVDLIAAQGQAIQAHLGVVIQAGLALSPAVAGGLDSGMGQDGARLQALQVQQDLAGVVSPVANQSPQSILALFR